MTIESETPDNATSGLTRRELLKRATAVGVAAWTAPVVSTFNAPAFGGVEVSPITCEAWDCGQAVVECGNGCFCDVDVEGFPFCGQDILCTRSPRCTSSAECPPGWRCTFNCCGQGVGLSTCVPPCGDIGEAGSVVTGGPRASGR